MEKEILHHWINELGILRKDLPYELVSVFSDSGDDDLKAAINLGLGHVERVLNFYCLLDKEDKESDDF